MPARAGVAESYYWLAQRSVVPPKEAFPRAKEAALQALAIDERSAEGIPLWPLPYTATTGSGKRPIGNSSVHSHSARIAPQFITLMPDT